MQAIISDQNFGYGATGSEGDSFLIGPLRPKLIERMSNKLLVRTGIVEERYAVKQVQCGFVSFSLPVNSNDIADVWEMVAWAKEADRERFFAYGETEYIKQLRKRQERELGTHSVIIVPDDAGLPYAAFWVPQHSYGATLNNRLARTGARFKKIDPAYIEMEEKIFSVVKEHFPTCKIIDPA